MDDILKRPDVLAMLDKDDHLDAVLLRPGQFRPEPLVVLYDVVAQFLERLLAIYDEVWIVKTLIVCNPQFRPDHLDILPFKLGKNLLYRLRFLACISYHRHGLKRQIAIVRSCRSRFARNRAAGI